MPSFTAYEGNDVKTVSSLYSSTLNASTIMNGSSIPSVQEYENEEDVANRMLSDFVDFEQVDAPISDSDTSASSKSIFSV